MHEEGWPPWVAERPLESETSTMANKEKKLVSLVMARRPGSEKTDVLSEVNAGGLCCDQTGSY